MLYEFEEDISKKRKEDISIKFRQIVVGHYSTARRFDILLRN